MSSSILFFGDFVSSNSSDVVLSNGIKELISEATIVGCNLEAPISAGASKIVKSGVAIKQEKSIARWMADNSFHFVQLANNHMLDFGVQGLEDTLRELDRFTTVGAGAFDEAYKIKGISAGEKTIGLISFCHYEFGITENEDQSGVAWINHWRIIHEIQSKKERFDFIIALPHAGVELIDAPLPEWRQVYKKLIDCGVDAVIATHPHIPQGWEIHNGKPIFYSLGNFYFDAISHYPHPFWNKSYAVQIFLGEQIEFKVHNLIFAEGRVEIDFDSSRDKHNQYLCSLILNDNSYESYINKETIRLYHIYERFMKQSLGGFFIGGNMNQKARSFLNYINGKRDYNYLLNTFRCESHRWLIQRALLLKQNE
jgi:poly-gamma-glutamate synthesis protein (capsule biosynthesis protein)